jgi:hypothetical protein
MHDTKAGGISVLLSRCRVEEGINHSYVIHSNAACRTHFRKYSGTTTDFRTGFLKVNRSYSAASYDVALVNSRYYALGI